MPDLLKKGSEDPLPIESAVQILLELGIQRKNLRIIAEGGFLSYQGEILRQEPKPGAPIGPETQVILAITEEGLYDTLPEGIFSSLGVTDRKQEEMEKEIRNFLATFDSLLFQSSSSLEYQKAVTNFVFKDDLLIQSILLYFGFHPKGWDMDDLVIWRTLFPTAPAWMGTKIGIEKMAKAFFGVESKVIENYLCTNPIPSKIQNRLGERESALGQDFLMGNKFEERESTFLLQMGPLAIDALPDFRPGMKNREKLERILSYVIPANRSYEIQFLLKEMDKKFIPQENPGYNLLGYSTYLG